MGGGAWPFLVGGAICPVNSVNERDLGLLTSYAEDPSAASFLEGLWPLRPRKFEAITDHCNCWSSTRNSYVRIAATWVVRCPRRREKSTEPYHLEEGEVAEGTPAPGVTRRCPPIYSFGIAGGRMMASRAPRRAVGINAKSSATHATTIGGCETSVARRVRSSRIEGSKKLLGSGSAFNATPASSAADRAQVHRKVAPERVRAPGGVALLPRSTEIQPASLRFVPPPPFPFNFPPKLGEATHPTLCIFTCLPCHALGLPCLALALACLGFGLPCLGLALALPCLAMSCLRLGMPCVGIALLCVALACRALACLGLGNGIAPIKLFRETIQAMPCFAFALRCLGMPCPWPRHAVPVALPCPLDLRLPLALPCPLHLRLPLALPCP
ncbi:unnamed protein product, partial [Prunus brigantina]